MLFHEIYGFYYNTVADILTKVLAGDIPNKKEIDRIIKETIPGDGDMLKELVGCEEIARDKYGRKTVSEQKAKNNLIYETKTKYWKWGGWQEKAVVKTPLTHCPPKPVTTLQKRWLKALLLDRRIQLFQPTQEGLEGVEPLYRPEALVWYDRYSDGDPYDEETYQKHFRTALAALRKKCLLHVKFYDRKGRFYEQTGLPLCLEYSSKDDKFRLKFCRVHEKSRPIYEINMSRIQACRLIETEKDECIQDLGAQVKEGRAKGGHKKSVVLELTDEREALERTMRQFSYLEKETRQLDKKRYQIKIFYDFYEETDLLIQILSFGAMVTVVSPESFRAQVRDRIDRQRQLQMRKGSTEDGQRCNAD